MDYLSTRIGPPFLATTPSCNLTMNMGKNIYFMYGAYISCSTFMVLPPNQIYVVQTHSSQCFLNDYLLEGMCVALVTLVVLIKSNKCPFSRFVFQLAPFDFGYAYMGLVPKILK
jgi:hypothetical protein